MRTRLLMSAALLGLGMASASAQTTPSGAIAPDASAGRPADTYAGTPHRANPRRVRAMRNAPDADDPGGAAPADRYSGVPPTSAYQGGAGSPFSSRASNIDRADTRGQIAPRLPNPDASGSSPQDYLAAAQRALASNRTGAAQEALERAETRLLTRATDPSMANVPDDGRLVQAVADARRALASNDIGTARAAIAAALGR